jgi:hypothetical protein
MTKRGFEVRNVLWLLPVAAVVCLGGCTHLKGVVVEEATGRPVRTAVLTVGRPNGIAVFERHPVDAHGAFDFSILPIDETNVYIYDSSADPELTTEHLDPGQLSDKMRLTMGPPPKQQPSMMEVPGQ